MLPIRRPLAVVTALAVVACTAAVALAAGAKFTGTTEQNRPVSFKLADGKAKNFKGGINMFCSKSGIQFNTAIPPKAMKVKDKKFHYKGRDKSDSTNIEINGKINGKNASGKIKMSDSTYYSSGTDFCSGVAKWTAKKG
jgi:phage tail sheath gpL-like